MMYDPKLSLFTAEEHEQLRLEEIELVKNAVKNRNCMGLYAFWLKKRIQFKQLSAHRRAQ